MKYNQQWLLQCIKRPQIDINKSQIIILLIILIPTAILICATFFTLMYLQNVSLEYIDIFAEQLYRDQIQSSQIHNIALVFQLNQQVQKVSWQMNILSEFMQKVLNEEVIKNKQYIQTYHNVERTYTNEENPDILALFHKNQMLTNIWLHVNKTKIEDLDETEKKQLFKVIETDPLMRSIKYESIHAKTRQFKIKDIFFGHSYDGMAYVTSFNTTYLRFPAPPSCPYFGKYKMDIRCRYYYDPTVKNVSIMLYDPQPFYSNGIQFLASVFCKRILQYQKQDPNSPSSIYGILCHSFDLSVIPEFFQNFGSSSKYQIFLDPRKLTVVYHSKVILPNNRVSTVQEFETQYLEDKEQAALFMNKINSFNKYILESTNNILNVRVRKDIGRKTFEYKRNGTECFVIINLITMNDRVPRYEYLKSSNPSSRYQVKGAYLFLDILSKEIMTQYSQDLQQKIKFYNQYFSYTSWSLSVLMLGFQIYYSFILGKNLMHPVIHLTNFLKSIRFLNDNFQDLPGGDVYNRGDRMTKIQLDDGKSEVYTEQNCMIQFDENLDNVNFDGICFSSDTQVLLNSFQNLFKILRFTTQNFYNENNIVSLLNLNIQIQHFDQFGNHRALGVCHNNIGVIHYNCGRFNEAIESFQKALIYAKYELNIYSHENSDSVYQINGIKKNSVHMRSTLLQKSNTFESINCKQGIVNKFDRPNNKSNFPLKDGDQGALQTQGNNEREQLYWNLYNRNQNYVKAISCYITQSKKESCNLWDLFQDIAIENATISSIYLPQSNKREMLDCYFILKGSFKQNFFDETSYLLNRFSNLYIKNFQSKNHNLVMSDHLSNEKTFINSNNSPIYSNHHNYFHKNNQMSQFFNLQAQNCMNLNESQLQQSQVISEMLNSQFLLTPLNIPKLSQRNNLQGHQQYHILKNSFSTPKNYFKLKKQNSSINYSSQNQHNNLCKLNNSPGRQCKFSENRLEFQQIDEDNQSQFSYIQNSHINLSNNQIQTGKPFSFNSSKGILQDIQNQQSCQNTPLNSEQNSVKKLKQSQQLEIPRLNSRDSNRQMSVFSSNQDPSIYLTTNKMIEPSSDLKSKKQSKTDSIVFRSNDKMNYINNDSNKNTYSPNKQAFKTCLSYKNYPEDKINKQQSSNKNKKIYQSQKKKTQIQSIITEKNQILYDKYESSLKRKNNYLNASLILTNVLEQCQYYLPHLKIQILSILSSIFTSQKLYSPELEEVKNNYTKIFNYNSCVCVISSCSTINSQIKTFKICSDILKQILFKNNDQFGLIKYSFNEGIYLQQMGLTNIQTIKSAPKFFENIITPCYLKNPDQKQKAKHHKLQKQMSQYKYVHQNSQKSQNLYDSTILTKSQICEYKQQAKEQNNIQSNGVLILKNEENFKESASIALSEQKYQEIKELHLFSLSSSYDTQISCLDEKTFGKEDKQRYCMKTNQKIISQQNQVNKLKHESFERESPQASFFQQNNLFQYDENINEGPQPYLTKQCKDFTSVAHYQDQYIKGNQKVFSKMNDEINQDKYINTDKQQNCQKSDNLYSSNQQFVVNPNSQIQTISYPTSSTSILQKQNVDVNQEFECSSPIFKQIEKPQESKNSFKQVVQLKSKLILNKLQQKCMIADKIQYNQQEPNKSPQNPHKNNNKIIKEDQIKSNEGLNINQNLQLFQMQIEHKEDMENSEVEEQRNKVDFEQVFHQGIHAALKYFILNSDEKLSYHISNNNFKKSKNCRMPSHKLQKKYLIYITDLALTLNNKYFLEELSELLWNLDLELLVLILNPNQTFEEFTSLENIFLNNKSVITFFQSEEKMLQYIYNIREHVKNNIVPMIVEHF